MVKPDTIRLGYISNTITSYFRQGTTIANANGVMINGISFNNTSASSQTVTVWCKLNTTAPSAIDQYTFTTITVPASGGPVFLNMDYAMPAADESLFMVASTASTVSAKLHVRWDIPLTGAYPSMVLCGYAPDTITQIYKHNTTFATELGTHVKGVSFDNQGDADIYVRIWITPTNTPPTTDDEYLYGPFLALQGLMFMDLDYFIKAANETIWIKADSPNKVATRLHINREIPLT